MNFNDLQLVKARKVGNSIVLTCPYAIEGRHYSVSVSNSGMIVYTPIKVLVRESTKNNLNKTLAMYEGD